MLYCNLTILKGRYAQWRGMPRPLKKSTNQEVLIRHVTTAFCRMKRVYGPLFALSLHRPSSNPLSPNPQWKRRADLPDSSTSSSQVFL